MYYNNCCPIYDEQVVLSVEEFITNCEIINQLLSSGKIKLHVVNSNLVRFIYDNEFINSYIQQNHLDRKTFKKDLREVQSFILAILVDNTELLFRYVFDEEDDDKELVREKVQAVEQIFITNDIKNYFKIKSTAKTRLIRDVEWDVSEKLFDKEEGKLNNIRYAHFNLDTTENGVGLPFISNNVFIPIEVPKQNILLTMTMDDVEYLLFELNELRRVMENE